MTFIDFHTHHSAPLEGETAIVDGRDTWGIHPWTLAEPSQEPSPSLLAIGECGLDKACGTPLSLQLPAFERCIRASETLRKPLFLHCVRAAEECLRLRKALHATQPWIWHGYRGGPEQLRQLLPHGFLFSFGFLHNDDALRACPHPCLLLETDDDPRPISLLYAEVSATLALSLPELSATMRDNFVRLFANGRR